MFYRVALLIVRAAMKAVFRIRAAGAENVPKEGGAIIAVNHRSNWDVVAAGITCPRKLRFMAKSELFKNKIFAYIITALGAFPIQRGKHDIGAVKSAMRILSSGGVMLIFPEGRRVRDNAETKPKTGAAMLAVWAKVPVIPVYISGSYRWMSRITVTYGKPIAFEEYYGKRPNTDTLEELSDGIMKTIRSLKV